MDALIGPRGNLRLLSRREIAVLSNTERDGIHETFRRSALAVLNIGSEHDDAASVLLQYSNFDAKIIEEPRGILLELTNAPSQAFVDGEIIEGIREHLFAVLRDLVAAQHLKRSGNTTDQVFELLRSAGAVRAGERDPLVVCWGGHSISRHEYDYTKEVGHALGLRHMDICTGCGPGAMKGPMKGAAVGHAKQRRFDGRYLGLTEPEIIAAEAPNPICNQLVILPDIEKRLEAFVRLGHAIIVFPGGVGTAEEILHLLGILLHPDNTQAAFPMFLTGPESSRAYMSQIDRFIGDTIGPEAQKRYRIIIDDPEGLARAVKDATDTVFDDRAKTHDAYGFNWKLTVDETFQRPFEATHENMAQLNLHRDQPPAELAANLRRAFSGIVAGNVKPGGIAAVAKHGKFQLRGDLSLMRSLDQLLETFVAQQRMRLPGTDYVPCYEVVHGS